MELLKTKRLTLIPVTKDILRYEQTKNILPDSLSEIFIPENWPHESITKDVLEVFLSLLNENRLYNFYWIFEKEAGEQILIGSGGFIVHDNGDYELGYSILKQYENQGYATEAVKATIKWLTDSEFDKNIFAKTEAENYPSIRILKKSGFYKSGFEENTNLLIYSYSKKET
ncbi:MAG: GNAT family N-acetyltransferase [Methanomicrobiaceae archaeon]|nr:GNAT family N-acetyltransferase [Methanomicrobiaceae archaeon]